MISVNKEALAWCAGFFDGEGNTNCSSGRIQITIPQVHREELDFFMEAIGGLGKVNGPYRPPSFKDHWKGLWVFKINNFESAQQVICYIWPWLKTAKKEQVTKAFKSYIEYHVNKKKRNRRYVRGIQEGKKFCPDCADYVDLSNFHSNPRNSTGLQTYCNPHYSNRVIKSRDKR